MNEYKVIDSILAIVKLRLCPGCCGDCEVYNSYDWRTCEVCNGEGIIKVFKQSK